MKHYVIKTIFILFFSSILVYGGFKTKKTYTAPQKDPIYVKVEIAVFDKDQEILELMLNKKELPLKPKDPKKNRGSIFLKLKPNTYTISWSTKNQKHSWPRKLNHKKTFQVKKEDNWIYIKIEGKNISID